MFTPKPGQVIKDPWARFEAWRNHPMFNSKRNMLNFIPGFTWGLGAFIVAITIEKILEKKEDSHAPHHH